VISAKYNPIINNIVTKFLKSHPNKNERTKETEEELKKQNIFKNEEIVISEIGGNNGMFGNIFG